VVDYVQIRIAVRPVLAKRLTKTGVVSCGSEHTMLPLWGDALLRLERAMHGVSTYCIAGPLSVRVDSRRLRSATVYCHLTATSRLQTFAIGTKTTAL